MQWNIIQPSKKEVNPVIYDNMNEPRWHYAKWNKLDTKGQVLGDLPYVWDLTKWNSQKQRVRIGGCQGLGLCRGGEG